MNLITPYDTETTGLPLFRDPSDDPRQPHLVDICILAFNADGTLVDSFEAMVRPDGGHRARPDTEACARVYFAINPPM